MGFVTGDLQSRWAKGIIPFEIDRNGMTGPDKRTLEVAIEQWNLVAALKLVPLQHQSDYLVFTIAPVGAGGRASGTARQGRVTVSMDYRWADTSGAQVVISALMHEIGHVAGLMHEHQRPDRDHFVSIANADDNGNTMAHYGGTPVGPYDCASLMHYRSSGNAHDPTLKPGGCNQLSGEALSPGDIAALNYLAPEGVWWGPTGDEPLSSEPAVCSWRHGRIEVFARLGNGTLGHRTFDAGAWGKWSQLGPEMIKGRPTAVSWEPGRLDVFVRGTDDVLYHKGWWGETPPSSYTSMGSGLITTSPTVTSSGPRRLEVFARGTDSALWHMGYDGVSWSPWEKLTRTGSSISAEPAAWFSAGDRLSVLVLMADRQLYLSEKKLGGHWSSFSSIGSEEFTSAPSVSSWGPERLDVFARGIDNTLWQKTRLNQTWGAAVRLGPKALSSAPAAVSWGRDRIDVFLQENGLLSWLLVAGDVKWWRR